MQYLKIWTSFRDVIAPLTDEEAGRLFRMMLIYAETGEEPEKFDGNESFLFPVAKQQIDLTRDRYDKLRANGAKGGRPPKHRAEEDGNQAKPNETKRNQTKPNETKRNQTKPNETSKEKNKNNSNDNSKYKSSNVSVKGKEDSSLREESQENNRGGVADHLLAAYAASCPHLSQLKRLTDLRREAAQDAVKDLTVAEMEKVFEMAGKSQFLNGDNDRGWRADFDWLIKPENAIKVLEGRYSNGTPKPKNAFHNFEQRNVNYDELLADEFGGRRKRKEIE